jgi:hypothetical protein
MAASESVTVPLTNSTDSAQIVRLTFQIGKQRAAAFGNLPLSIFNEQLAVRSARMVKSPLFRKSILKKRPRPEITFE